MLRINIAVLCLLAFSLTARSDKGADLDDARSPASINIHAIEAGSQRIAVRELSKRQSRKDFQSILSPDGTRRRYRPGIVLAKFRNSPMTEAVEVPAGREVEAQMLLAQSDQVQFSELDVVLVRQFSPSDPELPKQWHHSTIHSSVAWAISLATHKVTLAIVDTPFQMNHPDLAANTVAGWDMVKSAPITSVTEGYYHSTIGAGMAAAAINNALGVSGAANCWLMPIDIGDTPTASDMHNAIVWAADHGVRVVNLSWDGAFSSVINEAGGYLKTKIGGMLFMSGVNGRVPLNYPAQPDIYAISMTDNQDQPRSSYGNHIDFAAPGWEIYSTTTNSTYEVDSGTSYSAPLVAGIVGWIMSVNPDLSPPQIEQILKDSAVDLGPPGWDSSFGWGRIDFGLAAEKTFATLPVSRIAAIRNGPVSVVAVRVPGATYRLFRRPDFVSAQWELTANASIQENGNIVVLTDPTPPPDIAFYRVEITLPRE